VDGGVRGEDVETFSKDVFEFGEVRIVGGDKGTGVETWLGWGDLMAEGDWSCVSEKGGQRTFV